MVGPFLKYREDFSLSLKGSLGNQSFNTGISIPPPQQLPRFRTEAAGEWLPGLPLGEAEPNSWVCIKKDLQILEDGVLAHL